LATPLTSESIGVGIGIAVGIGIRKRFAIPKAILIPIPMAHYPAIIREGGDTSLDLL